MRYSIILATALALSACNSKPAAENKAAEVTAPAAASDGPAFTATTDQASALIKGLGAPWADGTVKDGMRDAKTGGTVRTVTSLDGSAQVFVRPSGQVWQVRLIAGGANGCGDITTIRAAIPKVVNGLSPASKMTPAQQAAISSDLNDAGTRDHPITGANVSVVSGCRMWLTVTAA